MATVLENMYKRYTLFGIGEVRPWDLEDTASTAIKLYGEYIHAEFPIVSFGWERSGGAATTLDRLSARARPTAEPFTVVVYFTDPDIAKRNRDFKLATERCLGNASIMIQCEMWEPQASLTQAAFDTAIFDRSVFATDGELPTQEEKWFMNCAITGIRPLRATPARPDAYTLEITMDPETPWYKWAPYVAKWADSVGTGRFTNMAIFEPETEFDTVNEITGGNEFVLFFRAENSYDFDFNMYETNASIFNGQLQMRSSATNTSLAQRFVVTNIKGYEGIREWTEINRNPDTMDLIKWYAKPQEIIRYSTLTMAPSKMRIGIQAPTKDQVLRPNITCMLMVRTYRMGL